MNIDLTGKNILVTGATGELGRVIALTLARCGGNLVIHYLKNEAMACALNKEIALLGKRSMIAKADMNDYYAILAMKEAVLKEFGRLDIMVINAVIQYQWKNILDQSPKDYWSQFSSSVLQTVYFAKAFVPNMMENNFGRVIGINSECAIQCFAGQSAYVAGKRGMDGVFRVLAKEVGEHQITVNQIAPGWTISERDRTMKTEHQEGYEKNVPLRRRGTDQEIANVVAFLASDLASFISGAFIPVCGGNVMPAI